VRCNAKAGAARQRQEAANLGPQLDALVASIPRLVVFGLDRPVFDRREELKQPGSEESRQKHALNASEQRTNPVQVNSGVVWGALERYGDA